MDELPSRSLEIAGRTHQCADALGEIVTVEEIERVTCEACRATGADVTEFMVALRHPTVDDLPGGHEWLVEFRVRPRDAEGFARVLDEALARLSTAYRTRRTGTVGISAPRVTALPTGTFYRWMRRAGGLGEVPRVTNDRQIAEGLLALTFRERPEPELVDVQL